MQRVPPELTVAARALRRDPTDAERKLWSALRLYRPRFTRQLVIDRYIVDFACRAARLAIELDGGQHAWRTAEDAARSAKLAAHGWRVMRFWNNEVLENLDGVVARISADVGAEPKLPQVRGKD